MATGRGAKGSPRSTHRGWTADPAPSSATHHHRAAAQLCGPAQHAQGDDTTAPPHHPPTVSARPPDTGQHSGRTHSATAHPCGAPTTTTAVHGSARQWGGGHGQGRGWAGKATNQTDRRHLPARASAHPPGTPQLDHRVPCINMQSNGETAQLGHRFGFWNATTLLTARSSAFPRENHFKQAGTCQERAKTQVSVHKGGVS